MQEGIVGALQQLQQPNRGVVDILTWIHSLFLYIAVMAAKRYDLVAPIDFSHTHSDAATSYVWGHVMNLVQLVGMEKNECRRRGVTAEV